MHRPVIDQRPDAGIEHRDASQHIARLIIRQSRFSHIRRQFGPLKMRQLDQPGIQRLLLVAGQDKIEKLFGDIIKKRTLAAV